MQKKETNNETIENEKLCFLCRMDPKKLSNNHIFTDEIVCDNCYNSSDMTNSVVKILTGGQND